MRTGSKSFMSSGAQHRLDELEQLAPVVGDRGELRAAPEAPLEAQGEHAQVQARDRPLGGLALGEDLFRPSGRSLQLTEFVHPRGEEVVSLFPAAWGRKVSANPRLMARIDRWVNRDRRIETATIGGFLQFHMAAGLRRWRRRVTRVPSAISYKSRRSVP